jgi:hypothetical protein
MLPRGFSESAVAGQVNGRVRERRAFPIDHCEQVMASVRQIQEAHTGSPLQSS